MTTLHQPELVDAELVELTRTLGRPELDLVILAEGNTSALLPDGRVVVKASGSNMAAATAEDFVVVEVPPLVALMDDPSATQADLTAALDAGEVAGRRRRGSIEALVHVAVQAVSPTAYVGHTHPTAVVGMLASAHAETAWSEWVYSDEAVVIGRPLYVPYATPGIDLGRIFLAALRRRVDETGELPQLVLLGNHGIVAIAPTPGGRLLGGRGGADPGRIGGQVLRPRRRCRTPQQSLPRAALISTRPTRSPDTRHSKEFSHASR
jgi:rhamnose utilization protein RhaD (predicted bifunctional aldolase and dehydrogenase)